MPLLKLFAGSPQHALPFLHKLADCFRQLSDSGDLAIKLEPWDAGFFVPSEFTLSSLVNGLREYDGAVFVLTSDLRNWYHDATSHNPLENVYLEIGLAIGQLGQENVFVVKTSSVSVPSDLHGFTYIGITDGLSDVDAELVSTTICSRVRTRSPAAAAGSGKVIELTESSTKFYERFASYLQHSNSRLFIVGSGFDRVDKRAYHYLRVLAGCAHRHSVVRVETAQATMTDWIRMVALTLGHLEKVKLYVPRQPGEFLLRDLCLIGPPEQGVVELAFPSATANESGHIGLGVFMQSIRASEILDQKMRDLITSDLLEKVDAKGLLKAYGLPESTLTGSSKEELYFAYGSNMMRRQIHDRTPSVELAGIGKLADHTRVFGRAGTLFQDNVVTVRPCEGKHVWGGLFRVSTFDLEERMDFYEGTKEEEYIRDEMQVEAFDSRLDYERGVPAKNKLPWVYYSTGNMLDGRPSAEYLRRIIQGARELRLPEEHIQELESIKVTER